MQRRNTREQVTIKDLTHMAVYKVVILEKVFDKGVQYNFSFDLHLSKIEISDANHRGLDPV